MVLSVQCILRVQSMPGRSTPSSTLMTDVRAAEQRLRGIASDVKRSSLANSPSVTAAAVTPTTPGGKFVGRTPNNTPALKSMAAPASRLPQLTEAAMEQALSAIDDETDDSGE